MQVDNSIRDQKESTAIIVRKEAFERCRRILAMIKIKRFLKKVIKMRRMKGAKVEIHRNFKYPENIDRVVKIQSLVRGWIHRRQYNLNKIILKERLLMRR